MVISCVILTKEALHWFVDERKVSGDLVSFLQDQSSALDRSLVQIHSYESFWTHLKELGEDLTQKVFVDPNQSSAAVTQSLVAENLIKQNSLISIPKAIKNDTEIAGFRASNARDSANLCVLWKWLDEQLRAGERVTEVGVVDKLHEIRSKDPLFITESFETIAGFGSNGAIIHYKPSPETCAVLSLNDMFLLDSGSQFKDGTTDITRTFHFGEPTAHQKKCFTLVLKGHIALDSTVFLAGTSAHKLDVIARLPLWAHGLDYQHGTGHGYGSCLGVHEGPTLISSRSAKLGKYFETPMLPGMTVTNEPGYYEEGAFGIRIESDLIVRAVDESGKFNRFENITMVPIQLSLVDLSLLNSDESRWLFTYNARCLETLTPLLAPDVLDFVRSRVLP